MSFSPDSDRDYNDLNTYTREVDCGHWSNFETESFTDVAAVIEEEAISEPERQTARYSSLDFEVIEKSLSNTTVYTDETFTAEVVVKNEGSAGGTYHALITDMDPSLYSERVDIEPGETHTFSAPISYAEVDRHSIRINHRFLDHVTVEERQSADENVAVSEGQSNGRSSCPTRATRCRRPSRTPATTRTMLPCYSLPARLRTTRPMSPTRQSISRRARRQR
ncbi:hypothetical protein [Natronomonas gomsonensis]|uniref:hypothetical protein n=1 Tax=Natronomonas gomsonensis TaxID=1046043 RepID=UPI0020CA3649|nr:hypothetical protein [Natronomonas gomsonensis]